MHNTGLLISIKTPLKPQLISCSAIGTVLPEYVGIRNGADYDG